MLGVTYKPLMLSVSTLNVVMLNVVMLSVVIMSVVAPEIGCNRVTIEGVCNVSLT